MLRVIRCTLVAASITLTLVGCHDATSPPHASPRNTRPTMSLEDNSLTALEVAPYETGVGAIGGLWQSNHFVWLDPTADRRQKLFVHLPGTNNVPAQFTLLAKEAARLGYHVIVLMYPNTWAINICSNDPICEENVRLEVVDGIDRSDLIPVTPEHGIYNRLTKLLQHLVDTRLPDEGWSQFLENGEPAWSKIVMSGHSFGGSEAAMLAKLHGMDRVTLFAAPRDANNAGQPPEWVALGATPADRYYGLVHQQDPLSALTLASWQGPLGMLQFGAAVFEDASMSAPPYGGTHMLFTNRLPSTGTFANAHGSVAVDQFTPVANGTPLLRDAWRYVLVTDREPPVLSVPADFAVNATSPSGAVVSYVASATDNVADVVSVSCSPAPGSSFAMGTTTVTCMATDPSGNQTSATFRVTVLDAPAQLANLAERVGGLGLRPSGIATSLTAKLNAALAAVNAGDVATACTKLQDFINETRAQAGKMIPMTDATLLVTEAERIRAVLGC